MNRSAAGPRHTAAPDPAATASRAPGSAAAADCNPAAIRLSSAAVAMELGVVPSEVVDAADGWFASERGVAAVMVVGVEVAVKCAGSLAV